MEENTEDKGFYITKDGLVPIPNVIYCSSQLRALTERVKEIKDEYCTDKKFKVDLAGDIKVLLDRSQKSSEERSEMFTRLRDVEQKLAGISGERAGGQSAQQFFMDNKKLVIAGVGLLFTGISCLIGVGVWVNSKNARIEKKIESYIYKSQNLKPRNFQFDEKD